MGACGSERRQPTSPDCSLAIDVALTDVEDTSRNRTQSGNHASFCRPSLPDRDALQPAPLRPLPNRSGGGRPVSGRLSAHSRPSDVSRPPLDERRETLDGDSRVRRGRHSRCGCMVGAREVATAPMSVKARNAVVAPVWSMRSPASGAPTA